MDVTALLELLKALLKQLLGVIVAAIVAALKKELGELTPQDPFPTGAP